MHGCWLGRAQVKRLKERLAEAAASGSDNGAAAGTSARRGSSAAGTSGRGAATGSGPMTAGREAELLSTITNLKVTRNSQIANWP